MNEQQMRLRVAGSFQYGKGKGAYLLVCEKNLPSTIWFLVTLRLHSYVYGNHCGERTTCTAPVLGFLYTSSPIWRYFPMYFQSTVLPSDGANESEYSLIQQTNHCYMSSGTLLFKYCINTSTSVASNLAKSSCRIASSFFSSKTTCSSSQSFDQTETKQLSNRHLRVYFHVYWMVESSSIESASFDDCSDSDDSDSEARPLRSAFDEFPRFDLSKR